MNIVGLSGRLLRDPRYFDSADDNAKRLNFTIATNAGPRGGDTNDPHPMDVVVFGRSAAHLATAAEMRKGREVHVSGRLQANPNKAFVEDNGERYSREVWGIVCQGYDSVTFGRPPASQANGTGSPSAVPAQVASDEDPGF